jgi:hypothetical protein
MHEGKVIRPVGHIYGFLELATVDHDDSGRIAITLKANFLDGVGGGRKNAQ